MVAPKRGNAVTGRRDAGGPLAHTSRSIRIAEGLAILYAWARVLALLVAVSVLLPGRPFSPSDLARAALSELATGMGGESAVLLPTLGIRAPLVSAETWDDKEVLTLLRRGVVLLPTEGWGSPQHLVVTAHSSGGIRAGDYRYLFATIHRLRPGDPVIARVGGTVRTYRVREQRLVSPTGVSALPQGDGATLTLVSCWPVGSNTQRLLVIADG